MIQNVLPIVVDELNNYLRSQFKSIEDKAMLSNIVEQDGSIAAEMNKIIVSLIYIDKDTTFKASSGTSPSGNNLLEYSPPVNVNLTILFSAFFSKDHYIEALRYISGVIYFFQYKPLFTPQNTPKLFPSADQIYFDLLSIPAGEMMNYYSMLGSKYVHSVVYKMRMLTFSQDNIISDIPAIRGIDTKGEV